MRTILIVEICVLLLSLTAPASVAVGSRKRRWPPLEYVINQDCTEPVSVHGVGIENLVVAVVRTLHRSSPYDYYESELGDDAFPVDLNGDAVPEYFVPLSCGATGDCSWGLFQTRPRRFLGLIDADRIYIHRRMSGWSVVTGELSFSAAESDVATYTMRRGQYRRATSWQRFHAPIMPDGPYLPSAMLDLLQTCKGWVPTQSAGRSN